MTFKDLQGPSRTFENSWVPIISRGFTIGSDMPSMLLIKLELIDFLGELIDFLGKHFIEDGLLIF